MPSTWVPNLDWERIAVLHLTNTLFHSLATKNEKENVGYLPQIVQTIVRHHSMTGSHSTTACDWPLYDTIARIKVTCLGVASNLFLVLVVTTCLNHTVYE